ncbi:MAG: peptide chain release factor N(5)-glutamine methyltransferase [Spirochaetaceae bacterium]|nr:peptide chain release factor N(5)-glutamine methyltransferase [Spirochaetaceae bacterium]
MSKTVREILVQAKVALKDISSTPSLDARMLLEKATGFSHVQIITNSEEKISSDSYLTFNQLLEKRISKIPMAYILGTKEFYGRDFKVNEATLIPRPDTETLVEVALTYIKAINYKPSVLDLCTGTGCVGISIALECDCDMSLADISSDALEVASYNNMTLYHNKSKIIQTNLLEKCNKYDIIVSNPPYLTKEWCENVSEEVQKEPLLALEGFGNDGLSLIRDIIKEAPIHLNDSGGAIFFECDYRQTEDVKKILEAYDFKDVQIYKDLNQKERVVGGVYVRAIN